MTDKKTMDQKKAREQFKKKIKDAGLDVGKVTRIADDYFSMLKNANHKQVKVLLGVAAAFFNQTRAVMFKTLPKEGIIVPEKGITKLGGGV